MRDEEAFLPSILADPDDNTPRLIFADWLEEHGDPRGEFIRLQCALADANLEARERTRLLVREQELLAGHETEWAKPLHGLASSWGFRRGFVEEVTIDARTFLERGADLFRSVPVQHVNLRAVGTLLQRLIESPFLPRLTGLGVRDNLGDTGMAILTAAPDLTRLRHLDLGMNLFSIVGARALAAATCFSGLTTLILDHNTIADLGVYALAASPPLTGQLTVLNLAFGDIGPGGIRYLAESPHLKELRSLDLSHNLLRDAGVRGLVRAPVAGRLQALYLRECGIGPAGARALCEVSALRNLSLLDLTGNPIFGAQRDALRARFGEHACRF